MNRTTKLATAGLLAVFAWLPLNPAVADESPQGASSTVGIPELTANQGYVAVAVDSTSLFYTLKYKRPGEDSEHVAVEDIPVGRKVVFIALPAGTYCWSRVEFGRLRYLDYVQFRHNEVTSYVPFKDMEKALTFTVKAGVVNYPGDLILRSNVTSFEVKTQNREATLIAGLDDEQGTLVEKYGILYSGVGGDDFFERYAAASQVPATQLVAAPAVSANIAAPVSAADFFRQPLYVDAMMSPDGHLVASLIREDGKLSISVNDLKTGLSGIVYEATHPEAKIVGLRWVSDDTLVFHSYLWTNAWNNLGDMYSIVWEIQDGKPDVRLGKWGGGNWVASSLDGKGREALVAQFPDSWGHTRTTLYQIDMGDFEKQFDSSHRVLYVNGEYPLWIAKPDGSPGVIGFQDANGGHQYQMYVPNSEKWVDFKSADSTAVFLPLAYQTGTADLVVKTASGHGAPELWLYDPAHDKFLSKLYGDDRYGFDGVLYGGYDHHVVGVSRHAGLVSEYVALGQEDPALQQELGLLFSGSNVVIRDSSRDGKRLLVYVGGASYPGDLATFDTDTKKLTDITRVRPWLDKTTLAKVDTNSMVTKGGAAVDYLVSMPPRGKAPFPAVVVLHDGALLRGFDPQAQYLAANGFVVVDLYFGQLGAHPDPKMEMSPKQRESGIAAGVSDVLSNAAGKYPIDKNRVCLYGAGSAGYFALMGAIDSPSTYRCVAAYSAVTDLSLMHGPGGGNVYLSELAAYLGTGPQTSTAELRGISPVYLTSKLRRPVFIGQGENDELVDEEHAYRLKMMLDTTGTKHHLSLYQNEGHELTALESNADFYQRLLNFINISMSTPTEN